MPLALFVTAAAAAWSCGDSSPAGVDPQTPALLARVKTQSKTQPTSTSSGKNSGQVRCAQSYDSVTKVFGPRGDTLRVANHVFWVDSLVLTDTVSITAVAPADTVRWVRFQPDGLLFPPSSVDLSYGLSTGAVLYTDYQDCAVSTADTLRIAQVSSSGAILEYLKTWSKINKNPWSQATQFVIGQVPHFSNYAVAF
jgi:hypothetical protein